MSDFIFRDDEKYISFSQIELFSECSWRWKIQYIDKIKIKNIYLVFGNSIHEAIEIGLKDKTVNLKEVFQTRWKENFRLFLTDEYALRESKNKEFLDKCKHMYQMGPQLVQEAVESLPDKFPGWEILFIEIPLQEKLTDKENSYVYIGKIDLVLTDGEKIVVIDWKTSSWGWDAKKRNDKMRHYQLMLYKHFYAKKFEIDPDLIECYVALVKRTANKDRIEFIPIKGGKKKIQNSLEVAENVVYNIGKRKFIKNFSACKFCPFKKTDLCPGS